ncbi:hypothetical protein BaRGS_00015410 [Batillaria attramentaria]|uniref:Uncharacterized protein n=1 Tax=Batillaria attramentaria TaxID=370345 RepID=A0ABD0L2F1_9CAEN
MGGDRICSPTIARSRCRREVWSDGLWFSANTILHAKAFTSTTLDPPVDQRVVTGLHFHTYRFCWREFWLDGLCLSHPSLASLAVNGDWICSSTFAKSVDVMFALMVFGLALNMSPPPSPRWGL